MDYLTGYEIVSRGAYALREPPRKDDVLTRDSMPSVVLQPHYSAWFDRDFMFNRDKYRGQKFIWRHAEYDGRLQGEVDLLTRNISSRGLQNPVLIRRKNGVWHLHPGKTRVRALLELGIEHVPAIFVDYDSRGVSEYGDYPILGPEQLKRHFQGDVAPEMRQRGIRVPRKR